MLITPLKDIEKELEEIQDFLEITASDDINEIVERGNTLAVYIARSGKLLADAKYHKDIKARSEVINDLKNITNLQASVASKYFDTLCQNENLVVNAAERINRACTHQLDWCRTLISKAKEELKYLNL